jgi:hypothetical protein
VIVFFAFGFLGCGSNIQHISASTPLTEDIKTYNASFDKVWQAALKALSKEETMKVVEKSGGIIVTEFRSVDSKELPAVATTFLGKTYKNRYSLNITSFGADKTDVKVNVKLQAVQVGFFARDEKMDNVESYLRQKLFEKISANLGGGKV